MIRGFGVAALFIALIGVGAWVALRQLAPEIPFGPPPDPPTIEVPSGPTPIEPVGLEEWARYRNTPPQLAGSGFLLRASGQVLAATTAHSLRFGDDQRPLQSVAFAVPGRDGFLVESLELHGEPGVPRLFGLNLTIDFVLLRVSETTPEELVLAPDSRGGPQPGERVQLHSGIAIGDGRRMLQGTVYRAEERGAWVVMDELFEPGLMSGSPFISEHSGKVVGMALVAGIREGHLVIGMHPIGSLVQKAEAAGSGLRLVNYHR